MLPMLNEKVIKNWGHSSQKVDFQALEKASQADFCRE